MVKYYVIYYFVLYGLPLVTMAAVLATIVASGQTQIQFHIEVNKNMLISTLI
jgi:hypothetical protein